MTIANITNGESGASVRTSLNAVIDAVNAGASSPITYVGNPLGLRIETLSATINFDDLVVSGPVAATSVDNQVNGLTELHFGASTALYTTGSVGISSSTMTELDLGNIVYILGNFQGTLDALTTFTAPLLQSIRGNWNQTFTVLTTMDLPAFVAGDVAFTANALTTLNLPLYEDDLNYSIQIAANALVTLDLPSIIRNQLGIYLTCASLQNFTLGSGLLAAVDVFITNAALTQASVDGILVSLSALDGTGGTTSYDNHSIDLSGGTSASPGVTGLAAKAVLEGRGCTVTVN